MESQDKLEQVKKTDKNNTPTTLFVFMLGALLSAFVADIVKEWPQWIKYVTVSLLSTVTIIMMIRGKWKAIKLAYLGKYYDICNAIIGGIIGAVIAYISSTISPYAYRITFGFLCIAMIIMFILDQIRFGPKILVNLIIIYDLIFLLQITYIEDFSFRILNSIAKHTVGKHILSERITYDRGILGLYTSSATWHGKYISENGTIFEGYFVNNILNGEGKIEFTNGTIFEGYFVNNILNGEGKIEFTNGTIWKGTFVDDKLNGDGEKNFADGTIWKGTFVDNRLNGTGEVTFADGTVWKGIFVDNMLNGVGTMIRENGIVLDGHFVNNKLNGKGKITFDERHVWEGYFVDNELNGEGKMTFADGTVLRGVFVKDELSGEGKMTFADGTVKTIFVNDEKKWVSKK